MRRNRWHLRDTFRFLLLCLQALIFIAPVYWMIVTSFKPEADAIRLPIEWLPKRLTWENYSSILYTPNGNILRWTWNSAFVATASASVHVAVATLAAYPLARMRFRGRDTWFWTLLSSMMIPIFVLLIPTYVMMLQFNWIDTYHALIWRGIPGVFGVFLLRQFLISIPREYEEAARLDGANRLQILWFVIVPVSIPALATLFVFAFLASWNDFLWPLFVVHGDMQTLPVGLSTFASRFSIEYGKLMAATTLASVPVLLLYVFLQRYIEQGMTVTGLKE
jgi:multiple sugar transport system permease protein